jgi:DNA-binding Xre family transcriptional regulator
MLSLEEIREKLQDRRLSVIKKETGISYPTLTKIREGKEGGFNFSTITKLSEYLSR